MKFAITGSTGMIGSELTEMLLEQGHEVIVIVNPNSKRLGNIPNSPKLTVIYCDISNYESLSNTNNCDVFFHLAWKSSTVTERDNVYTQMENIHYCLDAIKLAHSWGAKTFVGTGSQAEYGPIEETITPITKTAPISGYGVAKCCANGLGRLLCDKLDMNFCWTRIVSVFGKHDSDHTLIMYLIKTFLRGEIPDLTKCEQIWDYLYSKDAADALIRIGLEGNSSKTYTIASGNSRTLSEFVKEVRDIVNPESEIGFGKKEYYPHQPMFLSVDISELKKNTGFSPKYTFREGVSEIVDYLKK